MDKAAPKKDPDPAASSEDQTYVYTRWGPELRSDLQGQGTDEPSWEDQQKEDWKWEPEEIWQEWNGVFYYWDGESWIKPRFLTDILQNQSLFLVLSLSLSLPLSLSPYVLSLSLSLSVCASSKVARERASAFGGHQ